MKGTQPNSSLAAQCIYVDSTTGYWYNADCRNQYGFVCDRNFGGPFMSTIASNFTMREGTTNITTVVTNGGTGTLTLSASSSATVSINPSTGAQGSSRTVTITSGYGGGVAAITLNVTDTNNEYSTVTVIATVICKLFPSYVK